jgi:hypothetical protein
VARDFTRFLDSFSLASRLFVPLVQSEYKIVDDFSGYESGAGATGYSDHKLRACYKVRVRACVAYCARPWHGPRPAPNYSNAAGNRTHAQSLRAWVPAGQLMRTISRSETGFGEIIPSQPPVFFCEADEHIFHPYL